MSHDLLLSTKTKVHYKTIVFLSHTTSSQTLDDIFMSCVVTAEYGR